MNACVCFPWKACLHLFLGEITSTRHRCWNILDCSIFRPSLWTRTHIFGYVHWVRSIGHGFGICFIFKSGFWTPAQKISIRRGCDLKHSLTSIGVKPDSIFAFIMAFQLTVFYCLKLYSLKFHQNSNYCHCNKLCGLSMDNLFKFCV